MADMIKKGVHGYSAEEKYIEPTGKGITVTLPYELVGTNPYAVSFELKLIS